MRKCADERITCPRDPQVLIRTRKNQLRIAEAARLAQAKALRQRDIRLGRLLDHNQRIGRQPAALAQGF